MRQHLGGSRRSITSLSLTLGFELPPDFLAGAGSLGGLATLQDPTLGLVPAETDLSWVGSLSNLRSFMLISSHITDISASRGRHAADPVEVRLCLEPRFAPARGIT
ncbi:MAG: hypothetical protein FWE61_01995 [Micrococcales bacterium]|nr:hypothetical protein [Micrococcales bacterium]